MRFVILTGLSGAGKTTGLHALEDAGYFSVDNLPPLLWPELVTQTRAKTDMLAIGVDVRTRAYLTDVQTALARLSDQDCTAEVVFLDAKEEVLVRRYNFTRRAHPLSELHLAASIASERTTLEPLRSVADLVLDTSELTEKGLCERLWQRFSHANTFHLRILSFGFKRGAPTDADTVLDVRALPNPYYDEQLRPHDGRHPEVQSYVFTPEGVDFYQQLRDFIQLLAQQAKMSGRHTYTIAIGCTGGQHRSVAVSDRLARDLGEHYTCLSEHRDLRNDA